ncbi:MAG: cobalamin-binding protein, partial [Endozoicomonas sp.]
AALYGLLAFMGLTSFMGLTALVSSPAVQAEPRHGQYCVKDSSDRSVCLKTRTPRIISLSPGSTELLFAAGAGSRVVAVDQYSDYPVQAETLPKVGGYPNISVEAIVERKPDLVVVWTGGNSRKLMHQLESIGIQTFHFDVFDFNDIERALRTLGLVAGTEQQANYQADVFARRLASLKSSYQSRPTVSVFFEIWRDPLMTVGNGQIINKAIQLCGGWNVYGNLSERIPRVSMESLVALDPQVIIGSDPRGDTVATRKALMEYWGRWKMLTAVQKKQLFSVTSDLIARPTPRMLDEVETLCLHLQAARPANARHEAGFAATEPVP